MNGHESLNLTKYVQDSWAENYKIIKEATKEQSKGRDTPCPLMGRLIIVNVSSPN